MQREVELQQSQDTLEYKVRQRRNQQLQYRQKGLDARRFDLPTFCKLYERCATVSAYHNFLNEQFGKSLADAGTVLRMLETRRRR
jgi:hypothetical protein